MTSRAQAERTQILLTEVGRYNGAIDGIVGAKTRAAVDSLVSFRRPEAMAWSEKRRVIAAAQLVLLYAGYTVGVVDGYWGNLTEGAYLEWVTQHFRGKPLDLTRDPAGYAKLPSPFPAQDRFKQFYGEPGIGFERKLVAITPPYPMRIDWNLNQVVKTIRIHQKCAESLVRILEDIAKEYGVDRIRNLGLDRFAGSYSHRKMRGGSAWSTHAYGAAIDIFAAPNGLTTRCPDALFCNPAYRTFLDIWESHGWTSLGRAIGRDYMHFQAGSVK